MATALVEEYNPAWRLWFQDIIRYLGDDIAAASLCIEHVGSTAVPGMVAKPIIDIVIVIRPEQWDSVKDLLEWLGYRHNGDQGLPPREVFNPGNHDFPADLPPHHLYVCPEQAHELEKHLAFRDYLMQHPEERQRLSALKLSLADAFDNDKHPYMEGKDSMVKEITEKALEWRRSA